MWDRGSRGYHHVSLHPGWKMGVVRLLARRFEGMSLVVTLVHSRSADKHFSTSVASASALYLAGLANSKDVRDCFQNCKQGTGWMCVREGRSSHTVWLWGSLIRLTPWSTNNSCDLRSLSNLPPHLAASQDLAHMAASSWWCRSTIRCPCSVGGASKPKPLLACCPWPSLSWCGQILHPVLLWLEQRLLTGPLDAVVLSPALLMHIGSVRTAVRTEHYEVLHKGDIYILARCILGIETSSGRDSRWEWVPGARQEDREETQVGKNSSGDE